MKSYQKSTNEPRWNASLHTDGKVLASMVHRMTSSDSVNHQVLSFPISRVANSQQYMMSTYSPIGNCIGEGPQVQNKYSSSPLPFSSVNHGEHAIAVSIDGSKDLQTYSRSLQVAKASDKTLHKKSQKNAMASSDVFPMPAQQKASITQKPALHRFSFLESREALLNSCRQDFTLQSSRNAISATNNSPMKGLKYVPICAPPMLDGHYKYAVTQEGDPSISLHDDVKQCRKRKLDSLSRESLLDVGHLSTNSSTFSGYFTKPNIATGSVFEASAIMTQKLQSKIQERRGSFASEQLSSTEISGPDPSLEMKEIFTKPSACGQLESLNVYAMPQKRETKENDSEKGSGINSPDIFPRANDIHKFSLGLNFPEKGLENVSSDKNTTKKKSSDWGKYLALSASTESNAQEQKSDKAAGPHYELRMKKLEDFLKKCDDTAHGYSQSLWPLSAAARSSLAVKLEQRAIMLSLEEVKEFRRLSSLEIFGKNSSTSTKDAGSGTVLSLLVPNPS